MLKTLKTKLFPTSEQRHILLDTMHNFNEACNVLACFAFEHKVFNKFALQKQMYSQIRQDFHLGAQLAIRAIAKTVEAIKANRKKTRGPGGQKTSIPTFKPTGAIVYDQRCFSFKGLEAVSVLTLQGRQVIPLIISGYHAGELAAFGVRGQADLIYTDGEFYLCVVVEVPEPTKHPTDDVLGVDLGLVNIATDSDHRYFSGAHVRNLRKRHAKARQRMQKKGTKSAKRLLKKRNRKEQRMMRDKNHCISKHLIAKAKGTGRAIALENLKGINRRTTVRKVQRRDRMSWSFAQLRQFIEYKATIAGVTVYLVDPRNTSRECIDCHHIDKRNRPSQAEFLCVACGFAGHADHVAALNIRSRAAVNQPHAEGPSPHLQAPPFMAG